MLCLDILETREETAKISLLISFSMTGIVLYLPVVIEIAFGQTGGPALYGRFRVFIDGLHQVGKVTGILGLVAKSCFRDIETVVVGPG